MDFDKSKLMYCSCGRSGEGKLFINNITNYLFSDEIFANYNEVEEGIWVYKHVNKYGGLDFYYVPEKSERVRKLCENTLKQLVKREIEKYQKTIAFKENEFLSIEKIESDNFDWITKK